jgi:cytochrome b561
MSAISPKKYPLSVCLFHWLVAIAIIGNPVIGWMLDDSMELMSLHKSIGTGILILAALRVLNKLMHRNALPASVNKVGSAQYLAEKAVHGLLYVSMLGIPVLGWLKTNAAGHAVSFFGLFDLPTLLEKNRTLSHLFGEMHSAAAVGLAVLLGLHVVGALVHSVLKSENVLTRILPFTLAKENPTLKLGEFRE